MQYTHNVVVLEDEPLIALVIEDSIQEYVCGDVALSGAATKRWHISSIRGPDTALVDVSLIEGMSSNVAARLVEMKVPFVVYSGLEPDINHHADVFQEGIWLAKPASSAELVSSIRECLNKLTAACLNLLIST